MDQVSRPMLIALAAVVVFAGAWFAVLRPTEDVSEPAAVPAQPAPKAPGQSGLESAVSKANGAVAESGASAKASEKAAADADGSSSSAGSATKPSGAKAGGSAKTDSSAAKSKTTSTTAKSASDVAEGDPSGPILAQLDKGRTVVAIFSLNSGADDAGARRAVRRLAVQDKKVYAAFIDLSDVAKYTALTTNIEVLSSPTVLVIGPHRKALTTTGYTDVQSLKQLVGDVRRDAGK